jgi:hypothetical protein
MIAWLADPLGHYGLGDRFVRLLAAVVGGPSDDDLSPAPETEVSSPISRADPVLPTNRPDIIILAPGATSIIEDKVDAGDQIIQRERLVEDYRHLPRAGFISLTVEGRQDVSPTLAGSRRARGRRRRRVAERRAGDRPSPAATGPHTLNVRSRIRPLSMPKERRTAHRVLCRPPRMRSHSLWEADFPVPPLNKAEVFVR